MTSLKFSQKLATTTCMTLTGQLTEVVVPAVQVTPFDGKVYRLLRPKENAEYGIFAKNKSSVVSAVSHVAWGSYQESKYISTCLTYIDALKISMKNKCLNGDIVSIDVDNAPVTVIHVWDAYVRTLLVSQEPIVNPSQENFLYYQETIFRFDTFAKANNEVLLVGDVPASCVNIKTQKQFLPNNLGQTS